jgi:hypothetical protein
MNETQPVDLISPEMPQVQIPVSQPTVQQPQQPFIAPTPAPAPPITNVAKQFAKNGQPVVQETTTRQVIYSPTTNEGIPSSMIQAPGTNRKEQSKIEYMATIYLDPNCQDWSIQIDRVGPARTPEGAPLASGPVETIRPPIPYPDVYERVKQLCGGGKYLLRILDDTGVGRGTMQFMIDTIANPPISRIPGNGNGYRTLGGAPTMAGAFQAGMNPNDDLYKLREAEQVARATKSLKIAEFECEDTDRLLRKRRRQDEAEERQGTAGGGGSNFEQVARLETDRIYNTFRTELREIAHATDRRFDALQGLFEKMMLTNGSGGNQQMFGLMAQMMKSSTDSQTALLTAILPALAGKKDDNGQFMEALKLVNSASEKTTQMMLQASNKNDNLIATLITNRLEHPDNAVKQALEMRESGWKQALEMWDRMEGMRGDNEPEDVINPEGGFFSNLGNVILAALQGFVSKGAKGGGKMAMDAIAAILQKPAGTTQFSQEELTQAANILAAQRGGGLVTPPAMPQPLLPPPQVQQHMPQPQPQAQRQPFRFDPRKLFDRVYETEDEATVPMQPQQQQQQPAQPMPQQVVPQQPLAEEMEEVVPHIPQEQTEEMEEEEDSSEYVNEGIEIMLRDLQSGRREHDWIDHALNKWDAMLLDELAMAPRPTPEDISAHINIIKRVADPALYDQLYTFLVNPKNKKQYALFLENFSAFLLEIKEPSNAAT